MAASAGNYRELLNAGRWFAGLERGLQDALLDAARVRSLGAGEQLFARGDAPDGLYAMLDGAVRIFGVAGTGKEALLTLVEPPTWFGEISLFDRQPRTHDAVAEGEALVLQVPQARLDALLERQPRWWRDLGLLLTAKLRLAFVTLEDGTLLPNPVRLARRLVWMADGYGEWLDRHRRVLKVRQEQLAMMLAVSRQTMNQLLKELEAEGLVRVSYGGIELLDLEGLRRVAAPSGR